MTIGIFFNHGEMLGFVWVVEILPKVVSKGSEASRLRANGSIVHLPYSDRLSLQPVLLCDMVLRRPLGCRLKSCLCTVIRAPAHNQYAWEPGLDSPHDLGILELRT